MCPSREYRTQCVLYSVTANDYKEYMCFVSLNELCGITVNEHITVTDDRVIPTLEGLFYGQIATLSVCIYI